MASEGVEMLSAEDRHVINATLDARRERYKEKMNIINAKKKENIQKVRYTETVFI